jgi:hypothetical protein
MTTPIHILRELDHRISDHIDVRLLWEQETDRVSVAVLDGRTGESIRFDVAGHDALDAFHHPYAYALAAEQVRLQPSDAAVVPEPGASGPQ